MIMLHGKIICVYCIRLAENLYTLVNSITSVRLVILCQNMLRLFNCNLQCHLIGEAAPSISRAVGYHHCCALQNPYTAAE